MDGGHLGPLAIQVVEGGPVLLWEHCAHTGLGEGRLARSRLFHDGLRQDIIELVLRLRLLSLHPQSRLGHVVLSVGDRSFLRLNFLVQSRKLHIVGRDTELGLLLREKHLLGFLDLFGAHGYQLPD